MCMCECVYVCVCVSVCVYVCVTKNTTVLDLLIYYNKYYFITMSPSFLLCTPIARHHPVALFVS